MTRDHLIRFKIIFIKNPFIKGGIEMLVCAICGKALKECCDLFHEAVTPDGDTVVVCNDCAIENDLQFEPEIEEK